VADVDPSTPSIARVYFFALDAARDLVARYVPALAPGSYLVLSALNVDITSTDADGALDTYRSNVARLYNHSVADIAAVGRSNSPPISPIDDLAEL